MDVSYLKSRFDYYTFTEIRMKIKRHVVDLPPLLPAWQVSMDYTRDLTLVISYYSRKICRHTHTNKTTTMEQLSESKDDMMVLFSLLGGSGRWCPVRFSAYIIFILIPFDHFCSDLWNIPVTSLLVLLLKTLLRVFVCKCGI